MKRLILGIVCLALCAVAEEKQELPRNPFWPLGFEGTRYPITLEPRIKPEPPKPPTPPPAVETNVVEAVAATNQVAEAEAEVPEVEEKPVDPLEDPMWDDAVKELHFGAIMRFSAPGQNQAAISINNRIYGVGDIISANYREYRFTWKIEALSADKKIKLKRITYRKIGTNP